MYQIQLTELLTLCSVAFGFNMATTPSEMENLVSFFEAFQSGHIKKARDQLRQLDLSSVISRRTGYVEELATKLRDSGLTNKMIKTDGKGDTVLHLAVREDHADLVKILVEMDASLCDCVNGEGESPLKLAVSLGFDEAVELLITGTSNALHCIVECNQVELVEYLLERERKVDLSKLINKPYKLVPNRGDAEETSTKAKKPIVREGDTPLHIAARNKYEHMVSLLLMVKEVDKHALDSEHKTAFDIAREVTEYNESFRTIRKLGDFRGRSKRFMYCAPQASHEKYTKVLEMISVAYEERRNSELVVAALLATMTCAALFTVPGGFRSEGKTKEDQEVQGTPLLISYISFKLFLVFDCIAFFLSLFVCIMWEMSSELTTKNKMVFMSLNSLLVCLSFGFSALGFMCAVYTMMTRKVKTFSWVVLGSLIFITLCGVVAFIHQFVRFVVKRARTTRLCGISLAFDELVEMVWRGAEHFGLLKVCRLVDEASCDLLTGHCKFKSNKGGKSSENPRSPSSCCFNRV